MYVMGTMHKSVGLINTLVTKQSDLLGKANYQHGLYNMITQQPRWPSGPTAKATSFYLCNLGLNLGLNPGLITRNRHLVLFELHDSRKGLWLIASLNAIQVIHLLYLNE